jgi:FG-GAP-like repeat
MNERGYPVFSALFLLAIAVLQPLPAQSLGSVPFEAAVVVADNQARFEALLDYDGDGRMDAVSVWFPSSLAVTVRGYRNDGAGQLLLDWSVTHTGIMNPPNVFVPTAVLGVGDFDSDGVDDFVLTLNEYVGYWISNGAGVVPDVQWVFPEPARIDELVAADFDGDGLTDVALREGVTIRVFLTQSSGPPVFTSSTTLAVVAGTTNHIFETKADGDGLADVGAISYGSGTATTAAVFLFALPGGVIQPPIQFQFTNANGPMAVSGDVDGDGDVDVLAFSMPVGTALANYQIARRTGPSSFVVEAQTVGGPATHLVDLDLDGDLDGACCSSGGGGPFVNRAVSKFELALNDGTGSFLPAFEIAGMGAAHLAGASDLDSDGDIDLVAGRCVYYGRGPSGLPPYPAAQGITVPLEIADLDDDGDPDGRPVLPAFQKNSGDGLFSAQAMITPPPPPGHTWGLPGFPGDFDGDGDGDVLSETIMAGVPDSTHLLMNLGCGVYADAGPAVPPGMAMTLAPVFGLFGVTTNQPGNCAVADLDLDGDLDIVVRATGSAASDGTGGSRIWINQGAGTFVQGPDLAGLLVIDAADMDPDGIVDLIAHQSSGGGFSSLVILKGTGAGYLAPAVVDNDTHVANRPAILDFDGDGDLDFISMGNNTAKRYRNLGGGAFSAPEHFLAASSPSPTSSSFPGPPHLAFVVDVDVDGLPDVVTTPLADAPNGMAILLNAALNSPNPPTAPTIRQIFEPRAFGDLDGDGDPDAIGFVLAARNAHFGPSGAGRRVQYGVGIPGSGGITPVIGETGPFRAGMSGELRIRGGLGSASGLLVIGFAPDATPVLGGTLLVTPLDFFPIQLGGVPGAPGAGSLSIPFIMPASLVGMSIFHQAGFVDGGAAQGISGTNGLQIDVGP